jgi:hypothetical protein
MFARFKLCAHLLNLILDFDKGGNVFGMGILDASKARKAPDWAAFATASAQMSKRYRSGENSWTLDMPKGRRILSQDTNLMRVINVAQYPFRLALGKLLAILLSARSYARPRQKSSSA